MQRRRSSVVCCRSECWLVFPRTIPQGTNFREKCIHPVLWGNVFVHFSSCCDVVSLQHAMQWTTITNRATHTHTHIYLRKSLWKGRIVKYHNDTLMIHENFSGPPIKTLAPLNSTQQHFVQSHGTFCWKEDNNLTSPYNRFLQHLN